MITKGIRLVLTCESEKIFHVTLNHLVHIVVRITIIILNFKVKDAQMYTTKLCMVMVGTLLYSNKLFIFCDSHKIMSCSFQLTMCK